MNRNEKLISSKTPTLTLGFSTLTIFNHYFPIVAVTRLLENKLKIDHKKSALLQCNRALPLCSNTAYKI